MEELNIAKIKDILSQSDVQFAGIFGSHARGDNRPDSDLDILIRFRRDDKSLIDLIHIQNLLSDQLGIKVDLVTEDGMSPYIKPYILKDLKIILGN